MLLPLFEQLLQQVHHLLHLFRCERPVFGPLHATILIQHHYSGTFFIQLPGTDDAIPGSGMFVRSSLESNKKLYPWSQFIVDSNGVALGAWQLDEESSAVVVLDKDGRVQWAKDGALTPEEVQQVMDLLQKLLK
jgi:YtfJ family uncharacterized protein